MPKRGGTRHASSGASARLGPLLVIGGSEDRDNDKAILNRFIEACGGSTMAAAAVDSGRENRQ